MSQLFLMFFQLEILASASSDSSHLHFRDHCVFTKRKGIVFSQFFSVLQCEWLLGDRKPSPEDLDKGIDTNSPLFQAILENPVVQLGLTNPKTLLGTVYSKAKIVKGFVNIKITL